MATHESVGGDGTSDSAESSGCDSNPPLRSDCVGAPVVVMDVMAELCAEDPKVASDIDLELGAMDPEANWTVVPRADAGESPPIGTPCPPSGRHMK